MYLGGEYLGGGSCRFTVWAPFAQSIAVSLVSPKKSLIPLTAAGNGYWTGSAANLHGDILYYYHINGRTSRPDPASDFQPLGVHNHSQVIDHRAFQWQDDDFRCLPLEQWIIYELHVGAFTPEGSFDGVIARLDELARLGINAIELMPVAQFPGSRNWGYDGVHPFAVQNTYGGPDGLKRLVNECHRRKLAVILDVVYNHLGPEGNYLNDFGPYCTKKYSTPWGDAINFDDEFSDGVRRFFMENALRWFSNYHVDGLRIDAIHGIIDMSAIPFLRELADDVRIFSAANNKPCYLIAESDLNDTKIVRPHTEGGYALDAQWCDDFHHALHTLLTSEKTGYYSDYGSLDNLAAALRGGFIFSGQYSTFRKRRFGNSTAGVSASRFIVFSQNHDQAGNRMNGERLAALTSFEALKLCAGIVLCAPYIPLIFMGEEYAEQSPFLYFVSHIDPELAGAVSRGRRAEFKAAGWRGEPPDPSAESTFMASKPDWNLRAQPRNAAMSGFYRELLRLRKSLPALRLPDNCNLEVTTYEYDRLLTIKRWRGDNTVLCIANFSNTAATIKMQQGKWNKILDSAEMRWHGPGASAPDAITAGEIITMPAHNFIIFEELSVRLTPPHLNPLPVGERKQ